MEVPNHHDHEKISINHHKSTVSFSGLATEATIDAASTAATAPNVADVEIRK
jgi:hypothetical protein